jgi:DeoR/GlpR family transcriptional regulator of sugar metabolism
MVRAAKQTSVVSDSSKIGRRSLSLIAPISSVHRVITDDAILPEQRSALESRGIVVVAV